MFNRVTNRYLTKIINPFTLYVHDVLLYRLNKIFLKILLSDWKKAVISKQVFRSYIIFTLDNTSFEWLKIDNFALWISKDL